MSFRRLDTPRTEGTNSGARCAPTPGSGHVLQGFPDRRPQQTCRLHIRHMYRNDAGASSVKQKRFPENSDAKLRAGCGLHQAQLRTEPAAEQHAHRARKVERHEKGPLHCRVNFTGSRFL